MLLSKPCGACVKGLAFFRIRSRQERRNPRKSKERKQKDFRLQASIRGGGSASVRRSVFCLLFTASCVGIALVKVV